jgi:hypothetical protein
MEAPADVFGRLLKLGARSVKGERIMFGRPGPKLDYWEGGD